MKVSRRELLRAGAAASSVGVGASSLLIGDVAAEHIERQPAHVTVAYDQDWLERYAPRLTFGGDARDKLISLRGLRATSTEETTDMGVYWAEYTHQEGYSNYDSHYGDHEPFYVEVDESGDVDRVHYTYWHWLRATSTI